MGFVLPFLSRLGGGPADHWCTGIETGSSTSRGYAAGRVQLERREVHTELEEQLLLCEAPADHWPYRQAVFEAVRRLNARLREGPDAPIRVAFFGPTGAGKSKLFNSLLGANVSPAGFRRPCTRRAAFVAHEAHVTLSLPREVTLHFHRRDEWRDVVLIDTPDFDSVEAENRDEAERIFWTADAFLFVTDVHKYGDQSTWTYLEKIVRSGQPAVIVLNKVRSEEPRRDFFSRLDELDANAVPAARRVSVVQHSIDDQELIPADDAGLCALADALTELVASDASRRELRQRGLAREHRRFSDLWQESEASLAGYLEAVEELVAATQREFEVSARRLQEEMSVEVDPRVKAEVFAGVLATLERIDIFRYPRKLLYLPVQGVKTLWAKWFPGDSSVADEPEADPAATSDTFQILERRLLETIEELRDVFSQETRLPVETWSELFEAVKPSHADLGETFRQREERFRSWLKESAAETASSVTGENKLKFVLAQVLYNGVVLGVQIHTGGGLMLGEVVTDAIVSPIVAKAVGLAVSSERVAKFEEEARTEHHRLLAEVLDGVAREIERRLLQLASWREQFETLRRHARELAANPAEIQSAFEAGRAPALLCMAENATEGEPS